jgi:hypothetical protein
MTSGASAMPALTVSGLLPMYPDSRTFSVSVGMSQRCHERSSHNTTFGDSARLAGDDGTSNRRDDNRSRDSRSSNAAFWHTNRLAMDDGIGWPGTHIDSDEQREPST